MYGIYANSWGILMVNLLPWSWHTYGSYGQYFPIFFPISLAIYYPFIFSHIFSYYSIISYILSIYAGWWFEPLWKIWKSIGMTKFPIYGKIKNGNQTTNQYIILFPICSIIINIISINHQYSNYPVIINIYIYIFFQYHPILVFCDWALQHSTPAARPWAFSLPARHSLDSPRIWMQHWCIPVLLPLEIQGKTIGKPWENHGKMWVWWDR